MAMTHQELEEFLKAPRLARLAVVKKDGGPHVSPVWYLWEDGHFWFTTTAGRVKGRAIRRDGRVAFTIDEDTPPYRGVIVEGRAVFVPERAEEVTRRLAVRYLGQEAGEAYARELLQSPGRTAFRVRPAKLITWDYRD